MKAQIEKDECLHIYAETYVEGLALKCMCEKGADDLAGAVLIHFRVQEIPKEEEGEQNES